MDRGVRVRPLSVLHKRSIEGPRTERTRTGRARLDPAPQWRILAVMAGDDRSTLRVDARRDEIPERQEAHHRCGQG